MKHPDHVDLLRPAGLPTGGTWADLGAGAGAFTLALRELLGQEAEVYAVDKDRARLDELGRAYRTRFGAAERLHILHANFGAGSLGMPPLDGIIMANSLHFVKEKRSLLERIRGLLKPGGILLLVEYNVDRGNLWVPYPLSFRTYRTLAPRAGFSEPRLLATHPSSFLREIYSAATAPVQ